MNSETPKALAEYLEENKGSEVARQFVILAFLEFYDWWGKVGKWEHLKAEVDFQDKLWLMRNHPDFVVWTENHRFGVRTWDDFCRVAADRFVDEVVKGCHDKS